MSARHAATPAEIAIAWIIARPGITAPIASATSLPQLETLIRAASLQLDASDMALLEAASAT
jgi:aryl-alcohol dehydrogenase-like predicted oxidoreductase